jgi:poly(A) polymerase
MAERGVLAVVLPEVDAHGLAALGALVECETRESAAPAALPRLAAMLPAEPRVAEQVAARLRLSTAQRKRLARLADRLSGSEDARALAYREGADTAGDLLLLDGRPLAPIEGWETPVFPLKGGEIVARGISAGPEVAQTLQAVEKRWLAEGFPGRERVLEILEELLSERPIQ